MSASQPAATASESIRKAAAAAFEALPAILLAGALLMPALAAFADDADLTGAPQAPVAAASDVGREIAEQGNRAMLEIRQESRESLRQSVELPKLS